MNRRNFVRTACLAGAGGMLALAGAGSGKARSQKKHAPPAEDKDKIFSRDWIITAVAGMESKLDRQEGLRLLEECGRACARKGSVQTALAHKGDFDGFIAAMRGMLGARNVQVEGKTVHLVWNQCYCPNVRAAEKVPPFYCNCSRGWMKEMFETALGKPVEVEVRSSVKRGDKECRLVVTV